MTASDEMLKRRLPPGVTSLLPMGALVAWTQCPRALIVCIIVCILLKRTTLVDLTSELAPTFGRRANLSRENNKLNVLASDVINFMKLQELMVRTQTGNVALCNRTLDEHE